MTDKCIWIICTLPVETFSRHMSYKIRNIIPIISVKKEMIPSSFVLDYIWILTNLVDRCLFVCFLKSINTFVNCELLLDALACPLQSQFSRPLCCFIWWRDYKNHKVLLPGDDKKGVSRQWGTISDTLFWNYFSSQDRNWRRRLNPDSDSE